MRLVSLSLVLMALLAVLTMADDQKPTPKPSVEHPSKKSALSILDWMLGSWTITGRLSVTTETWTKVSENLFRGASVTMKGNDTSFYEQLELVHDSIGIAYIALPQQNTTPTRFSLTGHDTNKAVFENPDHDFPKLISYEFRAPDTLHARIEGPGKDGKTKGMDFVFTRKK